MGWFNLNKKSKTIKRDESGKIIGVVDLEKEIARPYVADANFITLFYTLPEVFFPINYIAHRVASGSYQLKRVKDDSLVFDREEINSFLYKPNPLFSFYDFIYSSEAYELATGNCYIKAALPELLKDTDEIWKWCDNYWVLPSDNVDIKTPSTTVRLFGSAKKEDIIESYVLTVGGAPMNISPNRILHTRTSNLQYDHNYLKGKSRLESQIKPISNLIPVYEARNIIYVKRGGLGFLVNEKKDDTGTIPMTKTEKENIRSEYYDTYGVSANKVPVGISDVPLKFVRTNLSIQELQPFEETLLDAISIAGAFGIPDVLVPQKDKGTFNNQNIAEKGVYSNIIIPRAQQKCRDLTNFMGLENSGYYLDVDFSHVDVLQEGRKEKEEVKKIASERCKNDFWSSVITLNDWRANIGESQVEDPLYKKLLLQMSDTEIEKIKSILNTSTNGSATATNVQNQDQRR